jgi:hypothetical protein
MSTFGWGNWAAKKALVELQTVRSSAAHGLQEDLPNE